ncbi:MAG: hypothetical protein ABIH66_00520 [bacterium]
MNDADKRFIIEHRNHIARTLGVIASATAAGEPNEAERIGVAAMLMNIYSGMETILRHILEDKGHKISKTGSWHKEILEKAASEHVISIELQEKLLEYLQFRHRHIHGYGFMLDWDRMKPLVSSIKSTADKFFAELARNDFLAEYTS